MTLFQEMFGKRKAIIAMAHFPPLPGQPLHDRSAGVRGVVDAVRRDLEHLADSGVDAVMFCNEGDRPYRTVAGPETTAVMGAAVAELSRDLPIPFGVDVLWDPKAALALAHATGAVFVREVFTGAYAGDFGVWNTDPAETLSFRDRIGADGVKMFYNVTAEFAAPIAPRDIALTARSAVFSSLADAVCVSGVVTGTGVDVAQLRAAKEAVGEVPVIANTGVNPKTVGQMLAIADACIVGTALKRDGVTWNEVDPERVKRLLSAAAESGHWEPSRRGDA
ncbi:SgcQ protein [Spongiactinospora rosea]|uniref:SgcQ protein n=1 Tax=Spongiactinospora rosea TaxID=2248750 RepID=A0A366M3E6_9ACTN|nr:BtpA/SgcQ family protein [Spongiactinospora rosea]RBQ20104.1 SgcQ protein [Spongiactinospora rosea]